MTLLYESGRTAVSNWCYIEHILEQTVVDFICSTDLNFKTLHMLLVTLKVKNSIVRMLGRTYTF